MITDEIIKYIRNKGINAMVFNDLIEDGEVMIDMSFSDISYGIIYDSTMNITSYSKTTQEATGLLEQVCDTIKELAGDSDALMTGHVQTLSSLGIPEVVSYDASSKIYTASLVVKFYFRRNNNGNL